MYLSLLLALLIVPSNNVSAIHIRFIAIAIGSRRPHMSLEIFGAAFDTAIEHAKELYPRVFQNYSVTRHFVPGSFLCHAAADEAVTSLATLFTDQQYSSQNSTLERHHEKEFRIIVSPGTGPLTKIYKIHTSQGELVKSDPVF